MNARTKAGLREGLKLAGLWLVVLAVMLLLFASPAPLALAGALTVIVGTGYWLGTTFYDIENPPKRKSDLN